MSCQSKRARVCVCVHAGKRNDIPRALNFMDARYIKWKLPTAPKLLRYSFGIVLPAIT